MINIIIVIFVLLILLYKILSSNFIKVECMNINEKKEYGLKIVHLSDVHIREKDTHRIIRILKKIESLKPDIIVITGDLLDNYIKDDSLAFFCSVISEIATTIAIPGNHEESYPDYTQWKSLLKKYGIIVLENESVEIKDIVFVGMTNGKLYNESIVRDIQNINKKYIILLSHRPELFEKHYSENNLINPNLVLSGHAHGGQFRLFNRGLYSPGQGLFPQYTSGVYSLKDKDMKMVVSRGLGHCSIPVRFNNSFHIPVIQL